MIFVPKHWKITPVNEPEFYTSNQILVTQYEKDGARVLPLKGGYIVFESRKEKDNFILEEESFTQALKKVGLGGKMLTEKGQTILCLFLQKHKILKSKKILNSTLESQVSKPVWKKLKIVKITTFREVIEFQTNDFLKFRDFGKKTMEEIEIALHKHDLDFGLVHRFDF